jgi:hypothetical protein
MLTVLGTAPLAADQKTRLGIVYVHFWRLPLND